MGAFRFLPSFFTIFILSPCLGAVGTTEDIELRQKKKNLDGAFFVTEIFQKYGSRDYMTFEGFEHLLENLGLGQLKFDINHDVSIHKVNGTFKEFHDELKLHKHNHNAAEAVSNAVNEEEKYHNVVKRNLRDYEKDDFNLEKICLTPQDLLSTYGMETSHGAIISRKGFADICPAIVYELDQKSCGPNIPIARGSNYETEYHLTWVYASLSILIMSVSGFLCIILVPAINKKYYKSLLEFLMATGIGTLCGDAFLHLLPHVLMHGIEGESKIMPILRGTVTLLSILLLFLIEIMLKYFQNERRKKSEIGDVLGKMIAIENQNGIKGEDGHPHLHGTMKKNEAMASMVIIADILHNVTDGLSIGAAFTTSIPAGFASSIAILSHELPHELGDYAALINIGVSKKKALLYNVASSIFSFFGMVLGILLNELQHATLWINAFTAGSFLYLALSDLVPEMKLHAEKGEKKIRKISLQIVGLIIGSLIMLFVALFEDDLQSLPISIDKSN